MRKLAPRQTASEQVYQAILDEVCEGGFAPGTHLVQEDLAERLGVSRQPVQQAMAMLKADGVVEEAGARGLFVAALDPATMLHRYEIRTVLDGLAASKAAEAVRNGDGSFGRTAPKLLAEGRAAIASGNIRTLVAADLAFHQLIYVAAGNPLIAPTAEMHWRFLRRAMADVLRYAEPPSEIWSQHAAIADAIMAGRPTEAGNLARDHVAHAADRLARAMQAMAAPVLESAS